MNKKGITITESLLALILVVLVVLVFIPHGSKIWSLIKISMGLSEPEVNNINDEKTSMPSEKEIKGEFGDIFAIKMEDPRFDIDRKPTSPDHCLVLTTLKNTGNEAWSDSDKIKVTLFCKHLKNQIKEITEIANYPASGYIKSLKPNEEIEIYFANRLANNCLESNEKYRIILYSNCDGVGTSYKPCDNFAKDTTKSPKIITTAEFECPIS